MESTPELKRCARCETEKVRTEFYANLRAADGCYSYCKTCAREKTARWREANPAHAREYASANHDRILERRRRGYSTPELRRRRNLRQKRGITLEAYECLRVAQADACAVCRRPAKNDVPLQVDHDHGTGLVRGLLCGSCNRAIGLLRDSHTVAQSAAKYLFVSTFGQLVPSAMSIGTAN